MDKAFSATIWLASLAANRVRSVLALLLLCLVTYLPGVLRVPAVDRTEIVYAETTRDMVARGQWLDPRYGDVVHAFRPIGTYWAQGVAVSVAGEANARTISVYRLPGLLAVTITVLALYMLVAPITDTTSALVAAGLFAVAPLTVLLSQLAITEGLALLPASIAMLALLRLYVNEDAEEGPRTSALLLWAAIGFGMLLNALQTPILICATLIVLFVMDRNFSWLKRTRPLAGLPVAILVAAPWIYVRYLQDGVPFAGMGWKDFLEALGGSQDMKLRAMPGTFLLAAVLGFLPGTALLAPALIRLWGERHARLARFLLSWIIGYIVYLEVLSSKPGTYTVQVMFPAFALAVALLVAEKNGASEAPTGHAIPWPLLAALFAVILLALPYVALGTFPNVWIAPLIAGVALLFYVSAREGRAGALQRWAVSSIAALSLFAITLLGAIVPSIDKIFPAQRIATALEGCPAGPVAVFGFREPSAKFVLQSAPAAAEPEALRTAIVEGRQSYIAGDVRDKTFAALGRFQYRRPRPIACVEALNAMRGCSLYFTVVATGDVSGCRNLEAFPCTEAFQAAAAKARDTKGCD